MKKLLLLLALVSFFGAGAYGAVGPERGHSTEGLTLEREVEKFLDGNFELYPEEEERFRRPRRRWPPFLRPHPYRRGRRRAFCVTENRMGRRFRAFARGRNRRVARRRACLKALRKCRRNSYLPRTCRVVR